MIYIKLFIALTIPAALGYLFSNLVLKKETKIGAIEKILYGYGIGLGFLAIEIFYIGLLRITFSLFSLSIIPIIAIFILLFIVLKSKTRLKTKEISKSYNQNNWVKIPALIIIVWILCKIFFVFYESLSLPVFSWDLLANWSAGAKFFYYEKGIVLDPTNNYFFGTNYREFLGHPLFSPLVQVWIAFCLDDFNEIFIKAWTPFYFVCILGIFFFAIKRETSLIFSLVATLLLSSSPLLTYHATDAYSDLPMGYYAFAGVMNLWRYIKTGNRNLLLLSGIFIGIGMFTKNEGIFFAIAILISLGIFIFLENKGSKTDILYFLIPTSIIIGPWIIIKYYYSIGYGHGITQEFIGVNALIYAIIEFVKVLLIGVNFNFIFIFLFSLTALNIKMLLQDNTKYLFLIIFSIALMFFSTYIMSQQEYEESLIAGGAVNRNILTYIAIVYFLTSLLAYKSWHDKRD